MKRLSLNSILLNITFLSFCFVQIQAMEGVKSASSPSKKKIATEAVEADASFLKNNRPHDDIGGDAFYTATSLQELIEKRGLETEISEYDTAEKAKARYDELHPDLQSIISNFSDVGTRTTRPYTHGAVFIGPPGIGKTTDGFAIAKHIKCKVVKIEAPMLCDIYQNSGSTKLARLYNLLKNYGRPVIVIIDEINSLTDQHRVVGEKVNLAMVDALVVWLDKFKKRNVFVIFTSNGIKDYPAKFYSRLGKNFIHYEFPSLEARKRMIQSVLEHYCVDTASTEKSA